MIKGFVLVSLLPGLEATALEQIRNIPGVEEVEMVFGRWDTVVQARAKNLNELLRVVVHQIRGLQGIQNTETLVSCEL